MAGKDEQDDNQTVWLAVMRRLLLVIGGICGSVLMVWQLVLSANSIIENRQPDVMMVDAQIQQKELEFPITVPGTDLVLQYPVLYEGPYVEDGSGAFVVDIASVVLFNSGQTGVERAEVVLKWSEGEYVFEVEMIPARAAVLVLDKGKQKFEQHQWTGCYGSQKKGDWTITDRIELEEIDGKTLRVSNTSNYLVKNIHIYYKSYLLSDNLYIGGITYCFGIQELAPGDSVDVSPFRYAKGYAKVVRVRGEMVE